MRGGLLWTLRRLSDANRQLGLFGEGIQQARESLEIRKWLDDAVGQAWCFNDLAFLLYDDGQLDAAEEATLATLELLEKEELLVCQSRHLLGNIYYSKGEKRRAIRQFQMALRIASPSIGTPSFSGFNTPSHRCSSMRAGSMMRTFTLNEQSHTPSMTLPTASVARFCCTLGSFSSNGSSKREDPRPCVRSRCLRSSGP